MAAGVAAYFGLWRLAFAVPVLVSGVLGLLIAARLPEPQREGGEAGPLTRLGRVRMMRLEVLGVLVPGLLSALTPNLMDLVAARVTLMGSSRR